MDTDIKNINETENCTKAQTVILSTWLAGNLNGWLGGARSFMQVLETTDLFANTTLRKHSISRDELKPILYSELSGLTLEEFAELLTNRFDEILEYADLSAGGKTCQKTSLLFNPHRLDTRTKSSKHSIYGACKPRVLQVDWQERYCLKRDW